MSRHRHGGFPKKKLLIVAAILVVLGVGAVGARFLLRKNPGAEQQQKATAAYEALKAGDFDKARLLYSKLVEEVPKRVELRLALVQCHMGLGQPDEAERHCLEILKSSPNHGRAHINLAVIARSRGDEEGAIGHAQRAVEGEPYARGAQLLLAETLLLAGRTSEGIDALTRAVEMEEGGDGAEFRLATLLAGEKPDNAASVRARQTLLKLLKRARGDLDEKPDDEGPILRFVQLAMIAGQPDDAVSALVRLSTQRRLSDRERMMLGRAYAASGSVSRARELIAEAETGTGEDGAASLTVAERVSSWLQASKPQKALDLVEPALTRAPGDLRLLHLKMRALWMLKGRASPGGEVDMEISGRIDTVATSVLAIRSSDERALKYRGVVRLARGDVEGALADADALKRCAPNAPAGYWLDGLTLLSGGHPAAALPLLVRGRDSATSPESASRWIARAAVWAGDTDIAAMEVANLGEVSDAALRAGALAVADDLDGAEAITRSETFRECPLDDRGRLALVLAARGRPDYARIVAEETRPEEGDAAAYLRLSELLDAAGDADAARSALEKAAQGQGPGKIRALMKCAEGAFSEKGVDRSVLEPVKARLRDTPTGSPFAELLEGLALLIEGDPDGSLAIAREVERSRLAQPGARVLALSSMVKKGVKGSEIIDAAIRVLEVSPNHAQARRIRAQGLMLDVRKSLGEGDLAVAEDQVTELLELTPEPGAAQMLRGILRTRLGEDGGAEQDARELLASPGSEAAGHMLMGILEYRRGAVPGAIKEFGACLELSPESPGALAALAACLILDNRAEEALSIAGRLEKVEPDGMRHLTIRAAALNALDKVPEAIAVLRDHVAKHPESIATRVMLGRILLGTGKPREAIREFEAAVKVAPGVALIRSHLVSACIAAKEHATAMTHAQATLDTEGLEVPGLILRSLVKRVMNNKSGELADLHAAVQRDPANPLARELLGARLLAAGRAAEARRELEKAVELSPRSIAPKIRLAGLAERENRILEAVAIYEQVLSQYPGHVLAANNLAYRLAGDPGTVDRAVELARMAAESVPENGDIQDTLAFALSGAGNHEEATRAAEKAMMLLPEEARIAVSAARVYLSAGEIEKATRIASRALILAKEGEREQIRSQIKALRLPSIGK